MANKLLLNAVFFILILIGCRGEDQEIAEAKRQSSESDQYDLGLYEPVPEEVEEYEYKYVNEPYPYDTSLSGGYHLSYRVDTLYEESMQYLLLMKNNKLVDTISGMSLGLIFRNLGFIIADYNDFFLFGNSFSFGSQNNCSLIQKSNGKTVCSGFFLENSVEDNWFMYTSDDVMDGLDTLFYIDMTTLKAEYFPVPEILWGNSEAWSDVDSIVFSPSEIRMYTYDDRGSIISRRSENRFRLR
ncbi:hypothetical protein K6119_16520 [Paracrocinitomix mangrovi]|uniref:hypothetical protein n=1 Tax=Paracrocinitomix mangrovi TaxID=2862509 RepID=UPI001C8E2036|nr:hypothetical protein [Paracrocinitomix mangrovi]UKN01333.1 hypothetical protein K6119_16520 [Paracrocinitomix mangrovi]